MISVVLGVVTVLSSCQALPAFPYQARSGRQILFTDGIPEFESAQQEFIQELDAAMTGLIGEVTGQYLEDTAEVKEAKAAFLIVFNDALNGFIKEVFLEDTADVAAAKVEFFAVFDAATKGLITTVENLYIEDTAEVKDAKAEFNKAFEDAKAGKVGAQYIPYTPEVQQARDEFFKFFDLVLNGMLYKLAPLPVENYYIPDAPDVNQAKKEILALYKSARNGDFDAALTIVALEEAIRNNENNPARAAEEFLQTATDLQEMIRVLEGNGLNKLQIEENSEETSEESLEDSDESEEEEDSEEELSEESLDSVFNELESVVEEIEEAAETADEAAAAADYDQDTEEPATFDEAPADVPDETIVTSETIGEDEDYDF